MFSKPGWAWAGLGGLLLVLNGCDQRLPPPVETANQPPPPSVDAGPPGGDDAGTGGSGLPDAGTPGPVDAGTPGPVDAGTPGTVDAGTPGPVDAGTPDTVDAGTPGPVDAGTPDAGAPDAGTPGTPDAGSPPPRGEWPRDPLLDYSQTYRTGSIKSAGIDDASNIWLLDHGNRIGVLRPGDMTPRWFSGIGQAGRGFPTTVICGGSANHAYVGYYARELDNPGAATPEQKSEGDADFVRLGEDGNVSLEQHLNMVNSNDHKYDETRTIFACTKVMKGPFKGEIYFGTNHAVTRVRGTDYSDHRHAVWALSNGSLRIGYNYAVSITQDGDVFLGNEWKIGMLTPKPELQSWIDFEATPWKLDTFVEAVGSQEDFDYWRATAQTVDRRYYVGSMTKGLWEMQLTPRKYTRVELPTGNINALAATDDGSLFIGTGAGLFRMKPDKTVEAVREVGGGVSQLFYDPTASPSMLLVVSGGRLYVIRGY